MLTSGIAGNAVCLVAIIFSVVYTTDEGNTTKSVIVKIVGGNEVSIIEYPYQVSFRIYDTHVCGGSLITKNYVLTAAHCVKKYLDKVHYMGVGMGHSRLKDRQVIHSVSNVLVHPDYRDDNSVANDIAILKLGKPAHVNNITVSVIPLATEPPLVGETCTVTGWGSLQEPRIDENGVTVNQLRAVDLPIVDPGLCTHLSGVNESFICAGGIEAGKDSCQGDSGGPLACDGKLAGIVSWGFGCGRKGFPGFYTDVSHYVEWIRNNSYAVPLPPLSKSILLPCMLIQFTVVF